MIKKRRLKKKIIPGIYYNSGFLNGPRAQGIIKEIENYYPIWEERFSKSNPPPEGDTWRWLKRPVYWLGNWQFACLGYYHPPEDILYRCVKAEDFPILMQKVVGEIEFLTRKMAPSKDIPQNWHLNTCLINYYGSKLSEVSGQTDLATVGDHKDAEPGPVASISLGERAWFQFVKGRPRDPNNTVHEQWLDHGSLLVFWGKKFKDELFHRVQRVENKGGFDFNDHLDDYHTRRINLTFRYVPVQHIHSLRELPSTKRVDIDRYINELSENSEYFLNLRNNEISSAPETS